MSVFILFVVFHASTLAPTRTDFIAVFATMELCNQAASTLVDPDTKILHVECRMTRVFQ